MMRGYAELRGQCRRRYILNYFGQEPDWRHCERCDVDVAHSTSGTGKKLGGPFAPYDRVVHGSLGRGTVERVTADAVTVVFDKAGSKTLDLDLVQEQEQHLVQLVGG
jgi:ATP-dependent DNA helicase RecQ